MSGCDKPLKRSSRRRPTMRQVAEKAGVSMAAVSFVLNGRKGGRSRVGDDAVKRIEAAAAEIGYAPNLFARKFIAGRSKTIGLVYAGDYAQWATGLEAALYGVRKALDGSDYHMLIQDGGDDPFGYCARMLSGRLVDAALVIQIRPIDLPVWNAPPWCPRPILLRCSYVSDWRPRVESDPSRGYDAAVEHLLSLGHRSLLWIHPTYEHIDADLRWRALRTAADKYGMSIESLDLGVGAGGFIYGFSYSLSDTTAPIAARLNSVKIPTAIMCWNDRIALSVIRALERRGLRVPEEVSVAGYDDFIAEWTVPGLSTVGSPYYDLGYAGAQWALRQAAGEETGRGDESEVRIVPTSFIPRGTTGPAAKKDRQTRRRPRTGKKKISEKSKALDRNKRDRKMGA